MVHFSGAGISTQGLWHYPSIINNATIATEIAQFAPAGQFVSSTILLVNGFHTNNAQTTTTTAGVINNIGGRLQMVFFMGWATDWSPTSNFLQHAYIHWMTRGLCKCLSSRDLSLLC